MPHPLLFATWITSLGYIGFSYLPGSYLVAGSPLVLYLLYGLFESLKGDTLLPESSSVRKFLLTRLGAFLSLLCFLIWICSLVLLSGATFMAEIMWAFDGGPSYSPLVVIAIFLANVSLLLYLVYGAFQCG